MNANQIEAGKTYVITVGKNTTTVKVTSIDRRVTGQLAYDCMNVNTNKRLTVTDAKRFVKEVKDGKANPIGKAAKKIAGALGFGAGSAKAKEDAELRNNIAETLAEAGAEPEHVEAAKVAMAVQAAESATKTKGKGGKKKGTLSGLDAAAQVLADSEVPLNVRQITERAMELGWAPEGKTPMNTLSAALQREIKTKGDASRFAKESCGLYVRK